MPNEETCKKIIALYEEVEKKNKEIISSYERLVALGERIQKNLEKQVEMYKSAMVTAMMGITYIAKSAPLHADTDENIKMAKEIQIKVSEILNKKESE